MWLWPTTKTHGENAPNKKQGRNFSLKAPVFIFSSSLWSQKCQRTTLAHLAPCSHHEDLSRFALCQFPMIECNWDQITPLSHSLPLLSGLWSLLTWLQLNSDTLATISWVVCDCSQTNSEMHILRIDMRALKSNMLLQILRLYSLGFVLQAIVRA